MKRDCLDLQSFLAAQATTFDTALGELRAGRKTSHWISFIFPQLRGLGHSPTAQFYGIADLDDPANSARDALRQSGMRFTVR